MLIAYIDETYEKSVEFAVIALVLPADAIGDLEESLNEIMRSVSTTHKQLSKTTELHGYEIASGEESWKNIPLRLRLWVYERSLQAIANIEGAVVCRGCVDLSKRSPNDGHFWSLTIALEQVDRYASFQSERVCGICDDVGNKSVYQSMYMKARNEGTDGIYSSTLPRFVDGLHFTPSHFSRLVQAVDLISYVYRRKNIKPYTNPRAREANDKLWEIIEPLMGRGFSRTW